MSSVYTITYSKEGAEFATPEEAVADKNQLFSAELLAAVQTNYKNLWDTGILIGADNTWDQATFQLRLNYATTDVDALLAGLRAGLVGRQTITQSELAGWTYLNNDRT